MDFHRTRREIAAHAHVGVERHILAPIVEMKGDGELEFVTVLLNGVLFLADGLLKLVKTECAFLD